MADATGAGYYPPPGPSYGSGYGMTFHERIQSSIGRNITVYIGDVATPVRGVLHAVGANYLEVHRTVNSNMEVVLIPLHAVVAIV